MTDEETIVLTTDDLRAVARFAASCAADVLTRFVAACPDDDRPRRAIEAAVAFADGGRRGKTLRDAAWAAMRAAGEAGLDSPAGHAAKSAMAAAGSAYLHPLAKATQVKHLLGSAAHAAVAIELAEGVLSRSRFIDSVLRRAGKDFVAVLRRYPAAPPGGGRVGALMREIDSALRRAAG